MKRKRKLVTDVMKSERYVYKKLHTDQKKERDNLELNRKHEVVVIVGLCKNRSAVRPYRSEEEWSNWCMLYFRKFDVDMLADTRNIIDKRGDGLQTRQATT